MAYTLGPYTLINPYISINGKTYFYIDVNGDGIASIDDVVSRDQLSVYFNDGQTITESLDTRTYVVNTSDGTSTTFKLPTTDELSQLRQSLISEGIESLPQGWYSGPPAYTFVTANYSEETGLHTIFGLGNGGSYSRMGFELDSVAGQPAVVNVELAGNTPASFGSNLSLQGDLEVGSVVNPSGIQIYDFDGFSGSYQIEYYHVDDLDEVIGTGESYTIQTSDIGQQIGFKVSFTDDVGYLETSSLISSSDFVQELQVGPFNYQVLNSSIILSSDVDGNGLYDVGDTVSWNGYLTEDTLSGINNGYVYLADGLSVEWITNYDQSTGTYTTLGSESNYTILETKT